MEHIILVVDDDPASLKILVKHLQDQGYKALVASNGELALERARHTQPALILLDILMPGLDGFETCRRLQADASTCHIPIIFMTGLTSLEHKLQGFREGGVDYITKPVQYEELVARVATHLRLQEYAAEINSLNQQLKAENIRVSADLQASEQKYITLVEEMTNGHFVLQNERIVFANQAFCEMHGFTLDKVLGKTLLCFVAPESRPKVTEVFRQSRDTTVPIHLFEYLRLTQDGCQLDTEMSVKTTRYEDTLVDIGICCDITERLDMERKMREAYRMADIGRITTSLSHEIRNPLSALKMNLQVLQKVHQFHDDDDAHRLMDLSIQTVMHLEDILGELLDFANPLHLELKECQINQIISACVDLLNAQFKGRNIQITSVLAPDIPTLQAHEKKLSQVFINLLLNAFQVSEKGGRIWLTSRYHRDRVPPEVEVTIEDEGPGILQEQWAHMFEPFFTTKPQGTGLGLTNVKHIVHAHKGRVNAANRNPRGAVFRVYLPL